MASIGKYAWIPFSAAGVGSGFGGMVFTLITGWVMDHYSYTPVFIGFGLLVRGAAMDSAPAAGASRTRASGVRY